MSGAPVSVSRVVIDWGSVTSQFRVMMPGVLSSSLSFLVFMSVAQTCAFSAANERAVALPIP